MNKKQIFSTLTNDPALSLTTALPKGDMIITFYDLNLKNQSAPSNHTFSFIHFTTAKHHLSLFMFSLYSITWLNKQGCVSGTVLGTSYKHIQSSTLCSKYGCHPSFTDEDAGAQRGDGSSARGQAGGAQSCSPVFSAARRGCLPVASSGKALYLSHFQASVCTVLDSLCLSCSSKL